MISETLHSEHIAQSPRRRPMIRRLLLFLGGFVVAAIALATPSVVSAAVNAFTARGSMADAESAVRDQDSDRAERALADAEEQLGAAASSLGSIWTLPARAIPLVGRQIRTARAIASAGALTARAGTASVDLLRAAPSGGWGLRQGSIDSEALRRAGVIMSRAAPVAEQALEEIERAPRGWLVPPLGGFRDEAQRQVTRAVGGVRKAALGLKVAPELFGANGPRRYLVMNSNPNELRGTSGFLGYFAVLDGVGGRLTLGESGRPARTLPPLANVRFPVAYERAWGRLGGTRLWQNVNVSPDFPTVADIAVQALSGSPPGPIDGVIQVAPKGLSALLRLSGPIAVEGWPSRITAENVVRIVEYEAYVAIPDKEARDAFGENLLRSVFAGALSSNSKFDVRALEPLGKAAAEGHIKMYSKHRAAQQTIADLDIDGGLADTRGATDVLSVFNQNGSGSKVDWFLHRDISYAMRVDPNTREAETHLEVTLRNNAPASGLPAYIIGPNDEGIAAGENQTIVGLLKPRGAKLLRLTVNGEISDTTKDPEHHLDAYQFNVSIPPGGRSTIEADFRVPDVLRDGLIDLRTIHQPISNPGRFALDVDVPSGWRADGGTYDGTVTTDLDLKIKVARTLWSKLLAPVDALGRAVLRFF